MIDTSNIPHKILINVAHQLCTMDESYQTSSTEEEEKLIAKYCEQIQVLTRREFLDAWLMYEGIVGFTSQILDVIDVFDKSAALVSPDRSRETMAEWARRQEDNRAPEDRARR